MDVRDGGDCQQSCLLNFVCRMGMRLSLFGFGYHFTLGGYGNKTYEVQFATNVNIILNKRNKLLLRIKHVKGHSFLLYWLLLPVFPRESVH